MENIIPCSICASPTSFERQDDTQPKEGEICGVCDRWVGIECVDWVATEIRNDEWVVCKECSKGGRNER